MTRSHAPAVLALAAGLAAPAYAQVLMPETTRWTLPDFDQRRSGLANSGNNHCVPTSHANMLAYISDHGFPLVFPNVTKSSWASEYQDITDNIFDLGMDMVSRRSRGHRGCQADRGHGERESRSHIESCHRNGRARSAARTHLIYCQSHTYAELTAVNLLGRD